MHLKFNFLLALMLSASSANAVTVLVNPPPPYFQSVMGETAASIYYAGRKGAGQGALTPTVANSLNTAQGFRYINTNDNTPSANAPVNYNGLIYLDVRSDKAMTLAANQSIAVTLKASGGTEVVLTGASEASGTDAPLFCGAGANCISTNTGSFYTANTTLRLAFTATALCTAAAASPGTLCTGGVVQDSLSTMKSQSVQVNFGVIANNIAQIGSDVSAAATNDQSSPFLINITDANPTTACAGVLNSSYFPGDGQIYFYPSGVTWADGAGAPVQTLVTMANLTAATNVENGGLNSNAIVHYTPITSSSEEITGFTNTTSGTDNQYEMLIQAQSKAGLISDGVGGQVCSRTPVQTQDISGILKESKCFIATAAFHDGRAGPVMMLRKFRDQILSKFSFGQDFIKTYYHYSPALAEWAWDKPIIRSFALRLLAPVELVAWTILKISAADEVAPEEGSQSYIDRLKKRLAEEDAPVASSESYTEREKKRLDAASTDSPDANQSYVDRIKKRLAEEGKVETPSEGYSEKEKAKLPSDSEKESPIKMVKEGRDKKPGLDDHAPPITSAAGFKLGVTPGTQVIVAGASHTYEQVYGSGFHPELIFHYEHQLFHSENFGSFGLGGDFGVAYDGGNGLLQFGFNNSTQSRTGFGFYQIPLIVNGTYRFNLLRILRPYVSAGAGAIAYTETRADSKGDKRGASAVYSGSLGASLLLDFLDSGTHRDSYLGDGIQHTFLFLEYVYLNTFKANVTFRRAGLYSGFTFEF